MSIPDLKCPHCHEVRATEALLKLHVGVWHKAATVEALVPGTQLVGGERLDLSQRLADMGRRLDQAGVEIRTLKAKADSVIQRMEALDTYMMRPEAVRRVTLTQVIAKLMDDGNSSAARIVMGMMDNVPGMPTR